MKQIGGVIEQAAAKGFRIGIAHLARVFGRMNPKGSKVLDCHMCDVDSRFLVRLKPVQFFSQMMMAHNGQNSHFTLGDPNRWLYFPSGIQFGHSRRNARRTSAPPSTARPWRICATSPRPSAARAVLRARVADDTEAARAAEQAAEKRGGRVAERFIIALPVEATAEQHVALAQAFAEELTRGVAGCVLAIHDARGNDARNPHCHLVAFDVFEKSGGRGRPRSVMGMAREGAVERAAALWARLHKERMDAWGYGSASRITNLSLAARGIDRVPTIHEGAAARKMATRGAPMATKDTWKRIDAGHTRAAANRIIREINQLKEKGGDDDRGDGLGGGDEEAARSASHRWDAFLVSCPEAQDQLLPVGRPWRARLSGSLKLPVGTPLCRRSHQPFQDAASRLRKLGAPNSARVRVGVPAASQIDGEAFKARGCKTMWVTPTLAVMGDTLVAVPAHRLDGGLPECRADGRNAERA